MFKIIKTTTLTLLIILAPSLAFSRTIEFSCNGFGQTLANSFELEGEFDLKDDYISGDEVKLSITNVTTYKISKGETVKTDRDSVEVEGHIYYYGAGRITKFPFFRFVSSLNKNKKNTTFSLMNLLIDYPVNLSSSVILKDQRLSYFSKCSALR